MSLKSGYLKLHVLTEFRLDPHNTGDFDQRFNVVSKAITIVLALTPPKRQTTTGVKDVSLKGNVFHYTLLRNATWRIQSTRVKRASALSA